MSIGVPHSSTTRHWLFQGNQMCALTWQQSKLKNWVVTSKKHLKSFPFSTIRHDKAFPRDSVAPMEFVFKTGVTLTSPPALMLGVTVNASTAGLILHIDILDKRKSCTYYSFCIAEWSWSIDIFHIVTKSRLFINSELPPPEESRKFMSINSIMRSRPSCPLQSLHLYFQNLGSNTPSQTWGYFWWLFCLWVTLFTSCRKAPDAKCSTPIKNNDYYTLHGHKILDAVYLS